MAQARSYSIVEPHPSACSSTYVHTARGGAGNVTRVPSTIAGAGGASGPAARASLSSASQPRTSFSSGRGGAGNMHHASSERAIFSFDEELERQLSRERRIAPVYHVGRGGAGNVTRSTPSARNVTACPRRDSHSHIDVDGTPRRSSGAASATSNISTESGADVATRNLQKWGRKVAGMGNYVTG